MSLFWAALSFVEYQLWNSRIRQESSETVRDEVIRLQRVMEHQILGGNWSAAEQALTWLAVKPPFSVLAALDEDGTVLLATRLAWKGQNGNKVLPGFVAHDVRSVLENGAPMVRYTGDGRHIVAYAPLSLAGESGSLRSLRKGIIFVNYDMRYEQASFWADLLQRSAVFAAASLLLAAALFVLLRKLVVQPLYRLAETAQRIEAGELGSGAMLAGEGELAQLGRAFDRMSLTLAQNMRQIQDREQNLAITLRSIGDAVIATDRGGRIQRINKVGEQLTGWTEQEALGRKIDDVFHIINAKTREPAEDPVTRVLENGHILGLANHTVLVARDGQEYQIADSVAPIRDEQGSVRGVVLVFRDVTEEYHTREALEFKQYSIDHTGDAIMWINPEGHLVDINQGACRMLGYGRDELLAMKISDLYSGDEREPWPNTWSAVREDSHSKEETVYQGKNGKIIPVEVAYSYLTYDEDEFICAIARDLTDQKKVERALREESLRNALLLKTASDGIHVLDAYGNVLQASDAFCRMLGYSPEEIVRLNVRDWDGKWTQQELQEKIRELLDKADVFETLHRRKDGSMFEVEICATGVKFGNQRLLYCSARDISQRKAVERALRESKERLKLAYQGADLGTWHWDIGTGQLVFDDRWAEFLGFEAHEAEHHIFTWKKLIHPDDWTQVMDALNAHIAGVTPTFETEHRLRTKFGEWIWILDKGRVLEWDAAGKPLRAAGTHLDITARRHAEMALRESESRFRELSDAAPVLIWMSDSENGRHYFNRGWLEFTGRTISQEISSGWMEGIHPDDRGPYLRAYRKAFEAQQTFRTEYRLRRYDGEFRWLSDSGKPRFDGQDRFLGFIGSCIDITEMKQAELELRLAASTFEVNEAIIITNAIGVIQRVNNAYCKLTGFSRDEVIGQGPDIMKSDRHDEAFYRTIWRTLIRDGFWQGEIWSRRKSGEICPHWLSITAVKNDLGKTTHYVGAFIDISMQKEAERQIRQLAYYDTLTGLPNRRLFYDRLNQALTYAARWGQYGGLLFIDLDHFKILNDTLGHDIGDELLIQVANVLTSAVREEDTVARLGGDEFVIVLECLGDDKPVATLSAEQVAQKLIGTLKKPFRLAGQEHHVTLSIGAVLFRDDTERPETLLKRADAAMYEAKAAGRNTACFFDPQMEASMEARVALLGELRKARASNQLQLYCQPLVNVERKLSGGEILLRWNHPTRGWIAPSEFIPLAEESGLIAEIGNWVLNAACERISQWEREGLLSPDFSLAVNISPRQFRQPNFSAVVRGIVQRVSVAPQRLKLEITEGMLISKLDDIIRTLDTLREAGLRFSLDDFGTGYSSLSYLQRLPLDQLKIDRSFVCDAHENTNDAVIVETIIAMGHHMGLEVVAEGVETEAQFEFLKARGCQSFQGYLFGRPMDLNDFERCLRDVAGCVTRSQLSLV
ncbi:MAG TPA: PAS domain S-box protein [Methylocaldum sp.]|nr:PAS domain S-box protein [Methylocaldum sp.]